MFVMYIYIYNIIFKFTIIITIKLILLGFLIFKFNYNIFKICLVFIKFIFVDIFFFSHKILIYFESFYNVI